VIQARTDCWMAVEHRKNLRGLDQRIAYVDKCVADKTKSKPEDERTPCALLLDFGHVARRRRDRRYANNAKPIRIAGARVWRAGRHQLLFCEPDQCRAALSGMGGFCQPNNFYDGRPLLAADDASAAAGVACADATSATSRPVRRGGLAFAMQLPASRAISRR
jgi:hypothetical protein